MNEPDSLAPKLAVILHADVVGSTELVRQDEVVAHERIQDVFRTLSGFISSYGGIPHEIRGDALVAEFSRVSDSLLAACAFQTQHIVDNESIADGIQATVRVGIALGEVVVADNTITGTGVVMAQRLEQLAEPGGVVIQGSVAETVPERLPFDLVDLGEQALKGIGQPVKCFAVSVSPEQTLPEPEARATTSESIAKAESGHARSKRPSIAVLPFDNMSGDTEQEYFSDGITEDIITELARFRDLFVIARNSSFAFKGKSVDVVEVGEKLGVQFILEGSVRKAGNRVRITAQLIDIATGSHLWADRYDRELEDVFAVQDEVVRTISSTLMGRVGQASRELARQKSTSDMVAYDWFVQGRELFYKSTAAEHKIAVDMFLKAVEQDPGYATAYALLSECYVRDWATYWELPFDTSYDLAWKYTRQALDLDDSDPAVQTAMGVAHLFAREYDQAGVHLNRAVELNPGDTHAILYLSRYCSFAGDPGRAIELITQARHHNPFWRYDWSMMVPLVADQRYTEAANIIQSIKDPAPNMLPAISVVYVNIGEMDKAKESANGFIKAVNQKLPGNLPVSWIRFVVDRFPLKESAAEEAFIEGLRKAGFPD